MRLYLTSGEKDVSQDGTKFEYPQHWAGTQSDARADRKALKEQSCAFIETKEVDVPTNKDGLLDFLNKNNVTVK